MLSTLGQPLALYTIVQHFSEGFFSSSYNIHFFLEFNGVELFDQKMKSDWKRLVIVGTATQAATQTSMADADIGSTIKHFVLNGLKANKRTVFCALPIYCGHPRSNFPT